MANDWVELRVHGVSGTPPESMLDFARVKQVAGDEFGRYFRRFDEHDEELPGHDGQTVEAYHWGKFTSGSWSQAIWLLLAPFGIVNAAQFTLEPPSSSRAKAFHTVAGAMLRVIGLALTALFVIGTAVITLDLWAWQRIGPGAGGLYRFVPAAAMLGPIALLGVCFFLGRTRLVGSKVLPSRPHARVHDGADAQIETWKRNPPTELVRPGFFGNDAEAPALRGLHLAAGLFVVALLGYSARRDLDDVWAWSGYWSSAVLLAIVGVCIVLLGDPERSASVPWGTGRLQRMTVVVQTRASTIGGALAATSVYAVAASVAHTAISPPPRNNDAVHYPGIDRIAYATMALAVLGMVVLAIANLALAIAERHSPARSGQPRFAPFAKGFACMLLTSLGVFVGVGFVGAFGVTAAKALETSDQQVVAPEMLTRVVYAWGLTAFLLVGLAVLGAIRKWRSAKPLQRRAAEAFTQPDGLRLPLRWVRHVGAAMWSARFKNSLVCLLSTFCVAGLTLSFATGYELLPQWRGATLNSLPGYLDWLSQPTSLDQQGIGLIMWIGTFTLTALAAGLVLLGRTALAGEGARRSVNVLWDVVSFWPRAAHPFVPPAYSQRAVQDIEDRIDWHLAETAPTSPTEPASGERRLVLCGHSQGSLLSFAALLRLAYGTGQPPDDRRARNLDDLGLLTFGSQLQVLFSRAFPAYVNFATIAWLHDRLGGAWRNLYRETDHLAGPALSWDHRGSPEWFGEPPPPHVFDPPEPDARRQYGSDWRLLDPPLPDLELNRRPLDKLRRHSDYWTDVAWDIALDDIRATPPSASDARGLSGGFRGSGAARPRTSTDEPAG